MVEMKDALMVVLLVENSVELMVVKKEPFLAA
jgi:hypothetical protein